MKRIKTLFAVDIPYYVGEVMKVAKVIFYEIIIALVVMGILYATNFRIEIKPNVEVVSPISQEVN